MIGLEPTMPDIHPQPNNVQKIVMQKVQSTNIYSGVAVRLIIPVGVGHIIQIHVSGQAVPPILGMST